MKKIFKKVIREIKELNKTKLTIKSILFVLEQIIAITLSVVICVNATTALGYLNIGNNRLKLADQLRQDNSYAESINWYKKITESKRKSFQKYTPYAYLALAEIYSEELDNKDYELAQQYYNNALDSMTNKDIRIYCSIIQFAENQIEIAQKAPEEKHVEIYDKSFIDLLITAINGVYELKPEVFNKYDLALPINESDARRLLDIEKTMSKTVNEWVYVSTVVSHDASLAFVKSDYKLLLIDTWQEREDDYSGRVNTFYKYYRYEANSKTEKISGADLLKEICGTKGRIYLARLHFDKNNKLIEGEL